MALITDKVIYNSLFCDLFPHSSNDDEIFYLKLNKQPALFLLPLAENEYSLFWNSSFPPSLFYEDSIDFLMNVEDELNIKKNNVGEVSFNNFRDEVNQFSLESYLLNEGIMREVFRRFNYSAFSLFKMETPLFDLTWSKKPQVDLYRIVVSSKRDLCKSIGHLYKNTCRYYSSEEESFEELVSTLLNKTIYNKKI